MREAQKNIGSVSLASRTEFGHSSEASVVALMCTKEEVWKGIKNVCLVSRPAQSTWFEELIIGLLTRTPNAEL